MKTKSFLLIFSFLGFLTSCGGSSSSDSSYYYDDDDDESYVDYEEAYEVDYTEEVPYETLVPCPYCNGNGGYYDYDYRYHQCTSCNGTGATTNVSFRGSKKTKKVWENLHCPGLDPSFTENRFTINNYYGQAIVNDTYCDKCGQMKKKHK